MLLPPSLAARPHSMTNHGLTREDPYFWLHEKDNPEVLAYLVANNEHV